MKVILFDVDGTLVSPGAVIQDDMVAILKELSKNPEVELGIVGGGTYDVIKRQVGIAFPYFKYIFAECGAVVYVYNQLVSEKNMLDHADRTVLNLMVRKALKCIAKMPIIYHGCQIDFRHGLVYISPPGMQATPYERTIFLQKDVEMNLRSKLLDKLIALNKNEKFDIVYGGAVGIAIYPKGWDKSQVVNYFQTASPNDELYYFGDRCEPEGNDYPIYSHPLVNGFAVKNYQETISKIRLLFLEG